VPGAPGTPRYTEGSVVAQKYRLVRILGEGGMGAVWVAQNLTLGVQVALKLIRSEIEGRVDGLSERLLTEARAAASIGHPAIIQVFDFGLTEHNEPFIAMELLHGESLAHVLKKRGRLAAGRAVRTLLPVIEALVVANHRGIVHRDLKPDNIFLSQQANRVQPKVLDFGIAKLSEGFSANLTCEGTVLGSPGVHVARASARREQRRLSYRHLGAVRGVVRNDRRRAAVHRRQLARLDVVDHGGQTSTARRAWPGRASAVGDPVARLLQRTRATLDVDVRVRAGVGNLVGRSGGDARHLQFVAEVDLARALAGFLAGAAFVLSVGSAAQQRSETSGRGVEPAPDVAPLDAKATGLLHGVVLESKSRIRRSFGARPASAEPATASKGWLVVTALGALVSFSIAVAYSLSGGSKKSVAFEDDEPMPTISVRQPSKNLGIGTRRDLLPGARAPAAAAQRRARLAPRSARGRPHRRRSQKAQPRQQSSQPSGCQEACRGPERSVRQRHRVIPLQGPLRGLKSCPCDLLVTCSPDARGWLAVACGGGGGQASQATNPAAAASQRLQGDWHLVGFAPSLELEPPLKSLLDAQLQTLSINFSNGQFAATGPGVDTGGRYEIIDASGSSLTGRVYDRSGVGYGISGQFVGNQFRFTSTDSPWAGSGVLERTK
jgi:hypothetical protein